MRLKYSLLLILFMVSIHSFSQYEVINNQDAVIYTTEQIAELNRWTCNLINKSANCQLMTDSLYIYNIFNFQTFGKLKKEDFLDDLFFKKLNLQPIYEKIEKGSTLPSSKSIILNKFKDFMGISWIHHFTKMKDCSALVYIWDLPIIQEKEKRNIMCYFRIIDMPTRGSVVFGRTYYNEIIVFHSKKLDPVKITPIREFIEKHWSEYFDEPS